MAIYTQHTVQWTVHPHRLANCGGIGPLSTVPLQILVANLASSALPTRNDCDLYVHFCLDVDGTETEEERLSIYTSVQEDHPRAVAPRRLPLNFVTGEHGAAALKSKEARSDQPCWLTFKKLDVISHAGLLLFCQLVEPGNFGLHGPKQDFSAFSS